MATQTEAATAESRDSGKGEPRQGGVHQHALNASRGSTAVDGAHAHIFEIDDEFVMTAEDGDHKHALADGETARDGRHTHKIRLPDGSTVDTGAGISEHQHALADGHTAVDGLHQHTLGLPDGTTLRSLTPEQFAQKMMLRDVQKGLWGSPAGKGLIAKKLVPMIPQHHTYVEPFAGGAAVFFEKESSPVDVLSDGDTEIMEAFRFVKHMTKAQFDQLARMNWTGDAQFYLRLRASKPTDPVRKFHRFGYLATFSFNALRDKATMPKALQGRKSTFMKRLERFAPKVRRTLLRQGDYEKVIREFDSPNTFFFLDPPYVGYDAAVGHKEFDEKRFREVLKSLKGKFLVTYGIRGGTEKDLFAGMNTMRLAHRSGVGAGPGKGMRVAQTLLAANYDFRGQRKQAKKVVVTVPRQKRVGLDETDAEFTVTVIPAASDTVRRTGEAIKRDEPRIYTSTEIRKGATRVQALHFPKSDGWTADTIRDWLAEHPSVDLARTLTDCRKAAGDGDADKAVWTTAFVNDLPDSAFLHIAPGGTKDAEGKTTPRSLRKLPVRGKDGKIDVPHLRNAAARLAQTSGLTDAQRDTIRDTIDRLLEQARRQQRKRDNIAEIRLLKADKPDEERFVLGVVLEPEVEDSQGDIYSAEEVRQAAHRYMEDAGRIGLMHRQLLTQGAKILENYLAPVDFAIDGQQVKKGTWLQGIRIVDDSVWAEVKSGDLTGLSIGGSAIRQPDAAPQK